MDAVIGELTRYLTAQGLGWVLFIMAVFISGKLLHMLVTAKNDLIELAAHHEEVKDGLHERRLQEARDTMRILHQASEANIKIAEGMADRTDTLRGLAALVTQLDRDYHTNNQHWNQRAGQWEQRLADIVTRLEYLQRGNA